MSWKILVNHCVRVISWSLNAAICLLWTWSLLQANLAVDRQILDLLWSRQSFWIITWFKVFIATSMSTFKRTLDNWPMLMQFRAWIILLMFGHLLWWNSTTDYLWRLVFKIRTPSLRRTWVVILCKVDLLFFLWSSWILNNPL